LALAISLDLRRIDHVDGDPGRDQPLGQRLVVDTRGFHAHRRFRGVSLSPGQQLFPTRGGVAELAPGAVLALPQWQGDVEGGLGHVDAYHLHVSVSCCRTGSSDRLACPCSCWLSQKRAEDTVQAPGRKRVPMCRIYGASSKAQ